jgi:hypothetical protein
MKSSHKPLAILAGAHVVIGAVAPFLTQRPSGDRSLNFVMAIIYAICLFTWSKADAAERSVKPGGAPILIALASPIGLPYYFFRTMPARQALLAIAKALGLFLLMIALYILAAFASLMLGAPES